MATILEAQQLRNTLWEVTISDTQVSNHIIEMSFCISCGFYSNKLNVTLEASKWSPHNSPTSRRGHEPEEDHTPHRKSVLSKVKEKARKLRHSLSGKKKHTEEENMTPSFGVTMEDEEDEEEDAEYLGAPSNTHLEPCNI